MTAATGTMRPVRHPSLRRRRSPLARWYRRHERAVLGIVGITAFLLFWELGSRAGVIDAFFFSRPTGILEAAVAEVQLPRFWNDVRVSAFEFFGGFIIAVGLGVPLGLLLGWYRRLSYLVDPWLNLFNSLPRLALLPIIVLWLGLGTEAKLATVFLGAFFSIVIPTVQGVRTVDRRLLDVATSFGASQRRIFTSVVLPATVPFIVTGIRLGIGRALIGVVLAEIYAQTEGLGVMIDRSADTLQAGRMFFGILIFVAAGVISVQGLRRIEESFQRWRPAQEES
ncbi:MAG TPA: ABC transporter permease [Candidatus Limnocylindrales bacterium]|nr:ABC transporter permease [Candidatus Limnocylindrales bacterium]